MRLPTKTTRTTTCVDFRPFIAAVNQNLRLHDIITSDGHTIIYDGDRNCFIGNYLSVDRTEVVAAVREKNVKRKTLNKQTRRVGVGVDINLISELTTRRLESRERAHTRETSIKSNFIVY